MKTYRLILTAALLLFPALASAATFNIPTAYGIFSPSFRGDADTSYLGWDTFGVGGDIFNPSFVINDITPDLGTDAGLFSTTNGEDHLSGSLNYYSGTGSVAEEITFATNGMVGTGYTTVIVQAVTAFGPFGPAINFGDIDGVFPTLVLQEANGMGSGQIFAKYELTGNSATGSFTISAPGPHTHTSIGQITVDTLWSPTGFSNDIAVSVPEPTSALLVMVAMVGSLLPASRR